jgi:predicted phosphodiesterase
MTLAFISDIHANLPALEATLEGIDTQHADTIYCLGDLVNQNVWNNEVVELIRERGIRCVKGNHDNGIALGKTFFRFSYSHPEHKKWGKEAIAYTLRTIKPENQGFLKALPLSLTLTLRHKGIRPFTFRLVHGSPVSLDDTLLRHLPLEQYRRFLEIAGTDVLVCGQAHTPYQYTFASEGPDPVTYRHVICPGSVGRPQDGDWRASYLLIHLDTKKDLRTDPEAFRTEFYRIRYDLDKAVHAIRHSELSVFYGGCLIIGQ